jgi:hypothetical protein
MREIRRDRWNESIRAEHRYSHEKLPFVLLSAFTTVDSPVTEFEFPAKGSVLKQKGSNN